MIRIEAVAAVKLVSPSPSKPVVQLDLACLPPVRAFLWDRPWARHLTAGDLVRIIGYPLAVNGDRRGGQGPTMALHAEGVYFEPGDPAKVAMRWQARAVLDELVLRPRGAIVTASARTPKTYEQLPCEATRTVAAALSAHPDAVWHLSGDLVLRGRNIVYRIRTATPAQPQAVRSSQPEVSHGRSEPETAPALR